MLKFYQVLLLCLTSIGYASPSFDCTKSNTIVEKQICQNTRLCELDVFLNELYQHIIKISSKPEPIKKEQILWLKRRPSGPQNLIKYYEQRIGELLAGPEFTKFLLLHKEIAEQYQKKCQKLSGYSFGMIFSQSKDMTTPSLVKILQTDKRMVQNLPQTSTPSAEACWKHFEKALDTKTFAYFKQAIKDADINILDISYVFKHSPTSMYIGRMLPRAEKGLYKVDLPLPNQTQVKISKDKLFATDTINQMYLDENQELWIISSGSSMHGGTIEETCALFSTAPEKKFRIVNTWFQTYDN